MNLSALSGMQAAALVVDRVGHDLANVDTPGAQVDVAEQVGRLITASIAYDANAVVARTQDDVARAAIDVRV